MDAIRRSLANLPPVELAEWVLVVIGVIVAAGLAVQLTRRHAWRTVGEFTPPPTGSFELADMLLLLTVYLLGPAVFMTIFNGGSIPQPSSAPTSAPASHALTAAEILTTLCQQLLMSATIITLVWLRTDGFTGTCVEPRAIGRRFLQAILAYIVIWPFCLGTLHLTTFFIRLAQPEFEPPHHDAILTLLARDRFDWQTIVTVLSAAVLAPLSEELFFRRVIFTIVEKWSRSTWAAIALSGLIFGYFHAGLPHTVPALCIFGVALGWLFAKTRSLTLVFLTHAIFNAKTLLWLALGARS